MCGEPQKEAETSKDVYVTKAGSRIKQKVKVTSTSNGNGGGTITIASNNGNARGQVKAAAIGAANSMGFDTSEIGAGTGHVDQLADGQYLDFDVSNPGLAEVQQSDLSQEEIAHRLQFTSAVELDASKLPESKRDDALTSVQNDLNSFSLTDEGHKLIRVMNSKSVKVILCEGCLSRKLGAQRNGIEIIHLNIRGEGFSKAEGDHTFVEVKGLRLLSHELVHALLRHRGAGTQYTEGVAVMTTNIIMKQHMQRLGFPNMSGARTHYGRGLQRLPNGAVLKENAEGMF